MPDALTKVSVARFIHLAGLTITLRGDNLTIWNGQRSLRCKLTALTTVDAFTQLRDLALQSPDDPVVDRLYTLLGDDLYGQLLYETEAS